MTIGSSARLLRGFAVDFLTSHDVSAVETVMEPDYSLSIGGHVFSGRDDSYLPATSAQLDQFPGLCVTIHDVVIGPDAVAMRFTEHGVSIRNGHAAAWGGVTLFRIRNGRLHQGWAEEDYFARKRQLASGVCDAVQPPLAAPFDAPFDAPDSETDRVARSFLTDPFAWALPDLIDEISAEGPRFASLVMITHSDINHLFTAGNRAAFHLECHGAYVGAFDDIDATLIGHPVVLRLAGLLKVSKGKVINVQVTADRLGLHRTLLDAGRGL
jgi:predicted ester cyclase